MGGSFHFIVILTLALLLPTIPAAPAEEHTLQAEVRDQIARVATERGMDPEEVLAAVVTLETIHPDGSATTQAITIARWIASLPHVRLGDGVGGGPHVTVGNLYHVYLKVATGSALAYEVQESTLVPATPAFADPTNMVFHAGGPLLHVTGEYDFGVHTVGTTYVGSNLDTHASGPYVPKLHSTAVYDGRIDFLGTATIQQAQQCLFDFCFAMGTLVGDGVVNWDGMVPLVGVP